MIARRSALSFILLLASLGCSAQTPPSGTPQGAATGDLSNLIERQVRAHYSVPPDVKVTLGQLHSSEFANFDALTVTFSSANRKQEFDFLLSHDHKTLMRVTKMDLNSDPFAETMKKIDTSGRPVRGNKDAKVKIVNYDDFECPFCSRLHATLFPALFKEYGDKVAFIYKNYPLEDIHPWAVHAAIDADCLASQNGDAFWEYADYLHSNQSSISGQKGHDAQGAELDRLASIQGQRHNLDASKLQACLKSQDDKALRASIKEGESLGVDATPVMFINGQKLDGAVPADEVRQALDTALRQAGVQPPAHKDESKQDDKKLPTAGPAK